MIRSRGESETLSNALDVKPSKMFHILGGKKKSKTLQFYSCPNSSQVSQLKITKINS